MPLDLRPSTSPFGGPIPEIEGGVPPQTMPPSGGNNPLGGVGPFGAPGAARLPMLAGALAGGGSAISPALGPLLIHAPEVFAAHMDSQGIPPPDDVPENVGQGDVQNSLGKALTTGGGIGSDYARGGDVSTPSQQGAAESPPLPTPRPTPAPESANASGARPAADTSKNPSTGTSKSALDDLGKALAGLSPMKGIEQTHVSTPQAYHPSNMISRSNLPSVLLQQLSGITKGTTGPYRLGQALQGIRNA